jgi:hypothetical protein
MRAAWLSLFVLLLAACAQAPRAGGAAAGGEPPLITRHPVDQVAPRLGTATFNVGVTGPGPLTYQWFRDGKPAPLGNAAAVTLRSVTENDVGTYAVTISNAAGSITSLGARLTLAGAPPAPAGSGARSVPAAPPVVEAGTEYFERGKPLRLAVFSEGTPPFTYQWHKDGRPIPGATRGVYTRPRAEPADAGTYVCVVTNKLGVSTSPPITVVVR